MVDAAKKIRANRKNHPSRKAFNKTSQEFHHKVLRYVSFKCFVAWLKDLKTRKTSDIKKLILDFNLLQALIVVGLVWLVAFTHSGVIRSYQNKVLNALQKANLTYIELKDGHLYMDIKPNIWVFSLENQKDHQNILVIDSKGTFNPFYWDDRFIGGQIKHINGVCFSTEKVIIKFGKIKKEITYTSLASALGIGTYKANKAQLIADIDNLLTIKNMVKMLIVVSPIVFTVAYLVFVLTHAIFSFITGLIVAMFSSIDHHIDKGIKIGAGIYVPLILLWDLFVVTKLLYHKEEFGLMGVVYGVLIVFGLIAIKAEVECDRHELFFFIGLVKDTINKIKNGRSPKKK